MEGSTPNTGKNARKPLSGGNNPAITSFFKKKVESTKDQTPTAQETVQETGAKHEGGGSAQPQVTQSESVNTGEKGSQNSPLRKEPQGGNVTSGSPGKQVEESKTDSPSKMSLRPRKVGNYQQILEGDEITIQEEVVSNKVHINNREVNQEHESNAMDHLLSAREVIQDDYEICEGEIERASDDEDFNAKLLPQKRPAKQSPSKSVVKRGRGRPAAGSRRIIEEDDDYLEADEQIDDGLLDNNNDQELLDAQDDLDDEADYEEDDDDESDYNVGGRNGVSRRKTKLTRKTRGSGRGSKTKASARGSAQRGRSRSTSRKKAAEEDEEFVQDEGEIEEAADEASENEDEDGAAAEGSDEEAEMEKSGAKGEETVFIDNLPNDEFAIRNMLKEVKKQIKHLERIFFEEEDSEREQELKQISTVGGGGGGAGASGNTSSSGNSSIINGAKQHEEALAAFRQHAHLKQFWCIPLSVNVTQFNFDLLAQSQMKNGGRLFDVITIDPPWQLSSANPTRGVAIAYDTLNDKDILNIPFDKIQTDGFLFIWVINAKYRFALDMMEKYGYKLVDEIAWVKQTVNGKIAKGHGYYLQHAKETCLVGMKGNVDAKARFNIESDVIFSQRRGQSQKPEEIYEIAEALVPNGYYLEIFGRRNNLHNGWVTIGNEL